MLRRAPNRRVVLLLATGLAVACASYAVGYRRTADARSAPGARAPHTDLYRDGTYAAWGDSYHGRILATVEIRRGRIRSVSIEKCRMRYPCSMIAALPEQVVARQSAGVDLVSGATQSAEAFAAAVDRALAQAARP